MSDSSTPDGSLLVQISGQLKALETAQSKDAQQISHQLSEIQKDNRDFSERIIRLEKDNDENRRDISNRTHSADTERLRTRVQALERQQEEDGKEIAARPRARLIYWALGGPSAIATAVLIAFLTGAIQP